MNVPRQDQAAAEGQRAAEEVEREFRERLESCVCTRPLRLRCYMGTWLCVCGRWLNGRGR